jgi:hypothetical protein
MFVSRCSRVVAVFALLALLVVGPGPTAAADLSSVTGRITLDGRPLPGGRILFHQGDQFIGARIKEDGTYKLARVPVGRHKVTVEFKGLPARYSAEDRSPLRVEVRKGTNTFDFELKSR